MNSFCPGVTQPEVFPQNKSLHSPLVFCLSVYRIVLICPLKSISISLTPRAAFPPVPFPPGQRTQTPVASSGVPNTTVALSWERYPPPQCTSRAGPYFVPNFNRTTAPIPRGLASGPCSRTRKPTLAPV